MRECDLIRIADQPVLSNPRAGSAEPPHGYGIRSGGPKEEQGKHNGPMRLQHACNTLPCPHSLRNAKLKVRAFLASAKCSVSGANTRQIARLASALESSNLVNP
jgi:hypothetical protein